MTDKLRHEAQQALAALDTLLWWAVSANLGATYHEAKKRAAALRTALAEQPAAQASVASEHAAMLKDFQAEVINCYELANRLDAFNPEENKAFTGTPSERIERQLRAHRVPGFSEDDNA